MCRAFAAVVSFDDRRTACLDELRQREGSYQDWLDCRVAAFVEGAECFTDGAICEPAATEACRSGVSEALDDCPDLRAWVREEESLCTMPSSRDTVLAYADAADTICACSTEPDHPCTAYTDATWPELEDFVAIAEGCVM